MQREHLRDEGSTVMVDHMVLNDQLPVGVLVIDGEGVVRHANQRAAIMTGYTVEELVDRSVLDFADDEDLEFMVASLVQGQNYVGALLGPLRVRYRHSDGTMQLTETWAHACPPELGIDGFIVTMSTESVTDNVANAMYQIASGAELDRSLATLARAVKGYPLVATGAMLLLEGGRLRPVGSWPFAVDEDGFVDDPGAPWHRAMMSGARFDSAIADLPEPLATTAATQGFHSVWVRPVDTHGSGLAGVFVAWRHERGQASANQDRHLAEVVAAAGLAVDSARHRADLERAAQSDAMTGLGNRLALAGHLGRVENDGIAVLYVDLDSFKRVNDEHGHDTGDRVLMVAARRLAGAVRGHDLVFRVGGDEFVIVCGATDPDPGAAAEALASRIVTTLAEPIRLDDLRIAIGASVGIAERLPGESTTDLIARADGALLAAKHAGKSRWERATNLRVD
jgi:diguanylate cyclase (GGDEF)-like protein